MKYIKALRVKEVGLMSGFFVIGAFWSINDLSFSSVLNLFTVWAVSFFTILAVYAYNAAAGKSIDKSNKRLSSLEHFSKKTFNTLGSLFVLIAVFFALYLDIKIAFLAITIFAMWVSYAHPKFGLKQKVLWGTVLHFVAQILHFNMCYMVFEEISLFSILLSIYFSFCFAIGHLNHEIIDYDSDKKAGIKNSATSLGIKFNYNLIIGLLMSCLLYTSFLYGKEIISLLEYLFFIIPPIIHLILQISYRKNIKDKSLKIRHIYRVIYFLSFVIIILLRLSKLL